MVKLVISGGQVGADQGGLCAAYDLNIPTGGTAPKGYRTLYGSNPKLALLGLKESTSEKYPPRTYDNVKNSDGTIRFANDFNSSGEACTLKAIRQYNKPYIDINIGVPLKITEVVKWIRKHDINILNVAGNAGRDRKESSLIFDFVRDYLKQVLLELNSRLEKNED